MIKEINSFCLIEKYFLHILGKCYNIFVISLYVLYVTCCKSFFFSEKNLLQPFKYKQNLTK